MIRPLAWQALSWYTHPIGPSDRTYARGIEHQLKQSLFVISGGRPLCRIRLINEAMTGQAGHAPATFAYDPVNAPIARHVHEGTAPPCFDRGVLAVGAAEDYGRHECSPVRSMVRAVPVRWSRWATRLREAKSQCLCRTTLACGNGARHRIITLV